MIGLNAWQLMLWIVCLAALLVPIIAILVNAIIISFYKAKVSYLGKVLKALSATIEQAVKGMGKKDE
jgi:hypothetical protein